MTNKNNKTETLQLELLKKENSKLQKEIREISIKSELNDWKTEDNFSSTVEIELWLNVTLSEINDNSLIFNLECSNDSFEYNGENLEIDFCEIENWFEEKNIPVTKSNLEDCIIELLDDNI